MSRRESGDEGHKIVFSIYTPFSVAMEEVYKRWNDKKLKKKVADFLGGDVPNFLKDGPKAVLVRDVISPNKEFFNFLNLTNDAGLERTFVEYPDSKFVAKNLNKYYLCKMFFHNGFGKHQGNKIDTMKVVDFNKYEGKKIKNLKTLWGDDFLKFHHGILKKAVPQLNIYPHDFSAWFNRHREITDYYYLHYLALFLVYGVLFDNFIMSKGERDFTINKVIPSFYKLEEIFGIKPLIVPLTPLEDESELYWWCYPCSVKNIADKEIIDFAEQKKKRKKKIELLIKDTGKYGKGVFAGSGIKKGQIIKVLNGEVISFKECIKRIKKGKENQDDSLQVGLDMDMDLDEFSRTFNHSCNPNAGIRKQSELFALRNIKKGEEITYDYSATVGPNISSSLWGMTCGCGSKNCRKKIGNVLSIPEKVLRKYIKLESLQDYMKAELKKIGKNQTGRFILPKYRKINLN